MEIAKRLNLEGKGIFLYLNPDMWAYTVRHATSPHRGEHILKPEDLTFRCVDIAGHRVYAVLYDVQNTFGVMESWGSPGLGLSIRGAEQLLEGIDHLWEVPLSDDKGPPEPTWTPEFDAHDGLRERISELVNRAPRDPSTFVNSAPQDVFLYPTGMAAVHHSTRTVLKYRPGTLVILGVVFHSTHHHLLEESPHGFKHIGKVDEEAMDEFERWLDAQKAEGKPLSYVLVEYPGNPTLDTPDVARLKRLVSTTNHPTPRRNVLDKEEPSPRSTTSSSS
jgi:cystathionine gamma-synthase